MLNKGRISEFLPQVQASDSRAAFLGGTVYMDWSEQCSPALDGEHSALFLLSALGWGQGQAF